MTRAQSRATHKGKKNVNNCRAGKVLDRVQMQDQFNHAGLLKESRSQAGGHTESERVPEFTSEREERMKMLVNSCISEVGRIGMKGSLIIVPFYRGVIHIAKEKMRLTSVFPRGRFHSCTHHPL